MGQKGLKLLDEVKVVQTLTQIRSDQMSPRLPSEPRDRTFSWTRDHDLRQSMGQACQAGQAWV